MAPATVLYDVDCGFCRWAMAVLLRWDRRRALRPVALQDPEGEALVADLPGDVAMASWHLVVPGEPRYSAGDAVTRVAGLLPGGRLPALALRALAPLVRPGYQAVADHRDVPGRRLSKASIDRATELIRERSDPDSLIQDDRVAASCSIAAPAACAPRA